jgi:osmotically-inducible protein OsmY
MPNPPRDPRDADRDRQHEAERDPTFEQTAYGADPWADTRVRDPRNPDRDPAADDRLRDAIAAELEAHRNFHIHDLEIVVWHGDVTLRGAAASIDDIQRVGQLVSTIRGVRHLVNLLHVRSS